MPVRLNLLLDPVAAISLSLSRVVLLRGRLRVALKLRLLLALEADIDRFLVPSWPYLPLLLLFLPFFSNT